MPRFDVQVDVTDFVKMIKQAPGQVRFATSKAINATVLQIQKGQRANLQKKFTIRRAPFANRSIKITQFAKKRILEAKIQIISPGPNADIFSKFEKGGTKTARSSRRVAIPQEIMTNRRRVLPKSKRPGALKRSWILTTRSGRELIMQTKFRGRRAKNIVAFSLHPRVQIPATLGFFKLTQGIFRSQWQKNFTREFKKAVATARPR